MYRYARSVLTSETVCGGTVDVRRMYQCEWSVLTYSERVCGGIIEIMSGRVLVLEELVLV